MNLNIKGSLNEILNKKKEPQKPEQLSKVGLIVDSDWRTFVPDKVKLLKNIEKAVDNKINNMIVDILNEYSNLKSYQYKDVDKINKELNKDRVKNDFDIIDDLNALQDFNDDFDDNSKSLSMRESI